MKRQFKLYQAVCRVYDVRRQLKLYRVYDVRRQFKLYAGFMT